VTSLLVGGADSTDFAASVNNAALHKLFRRIGEVSSLPSAAVRFVQLAGQESTRIEDLRRVIQSDPALAVRVLRRVNSAYYGLRNRVADLRQAIGLLGIREVRNLVLTVYVSQLFQEPGDYRTYQREALWKHSVCVGAAARLVSIICGRGAPDEAYLAGLIHDVGLILLDQRLRKHFCRILDGLDESETTPEIERKILGFDHADLGQFVARQWYFPDQVTDAIGYHHRPEEYTGPHADIVNVVSIANYLCGRLGFTSLGVPNVAAPPDEVYAGLDLDESGLRIIWDELEATLDKALAMANG
jgi:HD-like signal output (HDOD) protein